MLVLTGNPDGPPRLNSETTVAGVRDHASNTVGFVGRDSFILLPANARNSCGIVVQTRIQLSFERGQIRVY
jgi:hypothetical protein